MTYSSYGELRESLTKLPSTWYPDLIRAMVEASLEKGVWAPVMGATAFVHTVESDWHRKRPSCPSCDPRHFTQPPGTRNLK
jgi:hypothetical protein